MWKPVFYLYIRNCRRCVWACPWCFWVVSGRWSRACSSWENTRTPEIDDEIIRNLWKYSTERTPGSFLRSRSNPIGAYRSGVVPYLTTFGPSWPWPWLWEKFTVVHHSSTSTHIPSFMKIRQKMWMNGHRIWFDKLNSLRRWPKNGQKWFCRLCRTASPVKPAHKW